MIKVSDIVTDVNNIKVRALVVGETGSGKTRFGSTFPNSYFLITEPNGEDTFLTVPELRKNVLFFDRFIPESVDDTKPMFERLIKTCDDVREMAKKGEIETVVLDNLTYLAENRWIYINKFEPEISPRTGEINGQAMYGKLNRWLYNFVLMKLTSLPCNLVITTHQMLESDDAMDKKVDKNSPVMPAVLGGFRDTVGGLVSLVLFLGKENKGGQYKYYARTNLGAGKNAKSKYPNLPEVIENISFQTIRESIVKSISEAN